MTLFCFSNFYIIQFIHTIITYFHVNQILLSYQQTFIFILIRFQRLLFKQFMGQQNSYQMGENASLVLVQQLPIGQIFREEPNQSLYFIKEHAYTSQEAFQQAFIKFSKKLSAKNQNILNLQKANTNVENTFCSTFYKIILIFQYIDYSLADEIQMRNKQNRNFEEKQIWSVLFHCTLAIAHLRTTDGIQHSAIGLKDIKLSEDGTLKIMATEMIGIYSQHNFSEGTTKKLAMTILSCMLMKQVTNQSNEYLQALIDKTKCSKQLKKVLYLMIMQDTTFKQLQEYLFKLANDDNDSFMSGLSTPVYSSHKKSKDSIKILHQNNQNSKSQFLRPLNLEREDLVQQQIRFYTHQVQNPDQNDEVKNTESAQEQTTQNDEFNTLSPQNNIKFKLKDLSNQRQEDITVRINRKKNAIPTYSKTQSPDKPDNLYTDPKLLDLIKRDLEQIQQKSRISFGMRQSMGQNFQNTDYNILRPKRQSFYNIPSDYITKQISMENTAIKPGELEKKNLSQNLQGQRVVESAKSDENFNQVQNFTRKSTSQEYFSNILDEQASFKKQKIKRKTGGQPQVKKNVDKQNLYESTETRRTVQSNAKYESSSVEKQAFNRNRQSKLAPQTLKSTIQIQEQSRMQFVSQTYQKGQYKGFKLNGLRHGNGTFFYKQGGKYVGEWKQNKMNGKGTLYYLNDEVAYQGNWKDDQLHGYGTLYNQEFSELDGSFQYQDWSAVEQYWVKYQGEFTMDNKEGKGKWFLSNGQVFEGNFKRDMVDGQGVLSRQNGSRVKGIWRQNKLIRLY